MDFSYYNSSIYGEGFYAKFYIDFFTRKDRYLIEGVEYNRELLSWHYKEELQCINDKNKKSKAIDKIFWRNLSYCITYFKPLFFDEEIALKCGLIPFKYRGAKLLAFSGIGIESTYKLDAYQLLTHATIDEKSRIFSCPVQREYFENIVGKEITQKILQNWEKLNGKNLRV